jgi:hypothetical protein
VLESLTTQRIVVLATSFAALVAVCVPLLRGLRLCRAARRATGWVSGAAFVRGGPQLRAGEVEPLSVLMHRVFRKSLDDAEGAGHASELVLDASKQYTISEYETHYARPISMYANLLPPVGLTGNAIGMLILLVSKQVADAPLELAALGLAMISTIFALIGYALLEAVRLRLYGRLLASLGEVASLHASLELQRPRKPSPAAAPPSPRH